MTGTVTQHDAITTLGNPSAAVLKAREAKPEAIRWVQTAEDELFRPDSATARIGTLPPSNRHALAQRTAQLLGSAVLTDHHGTSAGPRNADDQAWTAALRFAELQTLTPALVSAEDVTALLQHWSPDDVMVIAQVVAYTSFRSTYLAGIALLSGRTPTKAVPLLAHPVSVGRTKSLATTTGNGLPRPVQYTRELLSWTPWVPPVAEEDLTDEQRDSFAGKTNLAYFRLLSRLPRLLKARTQTDLAIFYTNHGLPRAERELAAAVVSKINDCIYCASVHARKAAQMSKRTEDVDRLLAVELPRDHWWRPTDLAPLAADQDDRWAQVITLAAGLTAHPHDLTPESLDPLRHLGLTDLDLLDLVGSVAFFSWANRLMLTLGEPYYPEGTTS